MPILTLLKGYSGIWLKKKIRIFPVPGYKRLELFAAATGDVNLLKNWQRLIACIQGGNRTPKIGELDINNEIVFDVEIDVTNGNFTTSKNRSLLRLAENGLWSEQK